MEDRLITKAFGKEALLSWAEYKMYPSDMSKTAVLSPPLSVPLLIANSSK